MENTDDSDRTNREVSPNARILRRKQEFVKRFGTHEERLSMVKDVMKRSSRGGETRTHRNRNTMKGTVK